MRRARACTIVLSLIEVLLWGFPGTKCLYVDITYLSFDWGLTPRLWEQLHTTLLPSASSERHVEEWMAARNLVHARFVAVHIRQGDMLDWSEAS